ncbi:MAG: phenylalanine--tRNA ligase subunit beta [Candidatus Dojkabacteria bacterium]
MKTSINLLKQFGNIAESPENIIELIRKHIGAVENTHDFKQDYKEIVIAEIVAKKEHPDSEKLGIYQINTGSEEQIEVVARDKTLEIGKKVAYLKAGAQVPYSIYTQAQPFVIKAISLRGVMSNGMMGSEKELNIGGNNEQVLKLPNDAPIGVNFSEYYELDDTVVEIENKALTNRGDLFGIIGLARELTAITGNKFESPEWYKAPDIDVDIEEKKLGIEIRNDAEATCPRYTALVLDNVTIKDSPIWLKSALVKSGIKPINNIVDITNYIATLIGQPLHAFDYDKLVQTDLNSDGIAHINIRMAQTGESILGLDGKVHNLDDSIMVIADSIHPIAVAGIIGGQETEIDINTKRIVFESANFEKTSIRRSSMKLGIFTDAATRYKHALDTNHCITALMKALELCRELSGCKVASDIIDITNENTPLKNLTLNLDRLNKHLGTQLDLETVKTILENLEYTISDSQDKNITVLIPSWRKDVQIVEDIHEDIGRVYGFNNIDLVLPSKRISPRRKNDIFSMKKRIRHFLSTLGGNETLSYNFTSPETLSSCNLSPDLALKIKNPLAPELSLMRTSLLPSLILKSKENLQRGFEEFLLYEINIAHLKNYIDEENLPREDWYLSGVLVDKNKKENSGSSYYGVKHYLEVLFRSLHIRNLTYDLISNSTELDLPESIKNALNIFDPNTSAIIKSQDTYIGLVGQLRDDIKKNFKLPMYGGGFEINIQSLLNLEVSSNSYQETPMYPFFTQDLCFELNEEVTYVNVENEIDMEVNTGELSGRVECLDIYSDEKLMGRKRITYRITASSYKKTLNDEDIKHLIERITKRITQKYTATVI